MTYHDSDRARPAETSARTGAAGADDAGLGISRRKLLQAFGFGAAAVLVVTTGVLSYRAYDTGALRPGTGPAFEPWTGWQTGDGPERAVAAAVLAASPHNTQPWIFGVSPASIDLFVDRGRNTGTVDPFTREQFVGLGCALENLVIALRVGGFGPTVAVLPDGVDGDRVASVSLSAGSPGAGQPEPWYDAIPHRHTNRGPYDGRPVPDEILAELVDTTDLPPGTAVRWITDPAEKATLGTLLVDAAVAITTDGTQSTDNFAWFRGTDDEIRLHRDGLVLDGQGFSPAMLAAAKLLPASSVAAGNQFWVEQTRTVHTATAAGYGVITATEPDDRVTQLVAGRLLQRIQLAATNRGVALQHMNQITERIDREASTGAAATFAPRFAALLPAGESPLLTFRVGYPVRPGRPTPRRSAAQVTR